jgi:hypothetical protein
MTRRLTRSTVVGLALAAFAAPTALAVPIDLHTSDMTNAHAAVEQKQDLRSPDVGDAARSPEPKQDLRSPDARDAGEGRGTYTAPDIMVVKVPEPVPADDGIDWADAGIGAGGLLGLMLLGLGGSLAVVHRRQADATPGI